MRGQLALLRRRVRPHVVWSSPAGPPPQPEAVREAERSGQRVELRAGNPAQIDQDALSAQHAAEISETRGAVGQELRLQAAQGDEAVPHGNDPPPQPTQRREQSDVRPQTRRECLLRGRWAAISAGLGGGDDVLNRREGLRKASGQKGGQHADGGAGGHTKPSRHACASKRLARIRPVSPQALGGLVSGT